MRLNLLAYNVQVNLMRKKTVIVTSLIILMIGGGIGVSNVLSEPNSRKIAEDYLLNTVGTISYTFISSQKFGNFNSWKFRFTWFWGCVSNSMPCPAVVWQKTVEITVVNYKVTDMIEIEN
jgi:hypothetical protein